MTGDVHELLRDDEVKDPDGAILALRMQIGITLDVPLAQSLDAVVDKARAQVSGTPAAACHAFPFVDPHVLYTEVTGEIASAWAAGRTETGVAAVDTLLAPLGGFSIQPTLVSTPTVHDARAFILRFTPPANMVELGVALRQIPGVVNADILNHKKEPTDTDIALFRAPDAWRVTFIEADNGSPPPMATEVTVHDDGTVEVGERKPYTPSGPGVH